MQGAGGTDATGSNAKALADQAKKFEFFFLWAKGAWWFFKSGNYMIRFLLTTQVALQWGIHYNEFQ